MLKDKSNLVKAFENSIKKSQDECSNKLEELRDLSWNINHCFGLYMTNNSKTKKFSNSLFYWCYIESTEISGYTLYLTYCGLYRNAFDNIRHVLEMAVQALYIDIEHVDSDLKTKLEILKEIEDKREYHVSRLLQEKLNFKNLPCGGLDCKGILNTTYRELSQLVHPSHEKVVRTIAEMLDIAKNDDFSEIIDCKEVEKVFNSTKKCMTPFTSYCSWNSQNFSDSPEITASLLIA